MLHRDSPTLKAIEFASLLEYSPRGTSKISQTSRSVKDTIKAARFGKAFIARIDSIIAENKAKLQPFLNEWVTLVAAPRSSITRDTDLWPALEICKILEGLKLGRVSTCLIRSKAIKKSSLYFNADDRPTIAEQYESMSVENYLPTGSITLVDDIITLGRTSTAGFLRLSEKFPNATVRIFGLIKTKSLVPDIDNIVNVEIGQINYNAGSGKCSRIP